MLRTERRLHVFNENRKMIAMLYAVFHFVRFYLTFQCGCLCIPLLSACARTWSNFIRCFMGVWATVWMCSHAPRHGERFIAIRSAHQTRISHNLIHINDFAFPKHQRHDRIMWIYAKCTGAFGHTRICARSLIRIRIHKSLALCGWRWRSCVLEMSEKKKKGKAKNLVEIIEAAENAVTHSTITILYFIYCP